MPTYLVSSRTSLLYNPQAEKTATSLRTSDTTVNGSSNSATEGNATPKYSKGSRPPQSSLHRAVMEKLEVQKAMNDLAGVSDEGKPS